MSLRLVLGGLVLVLALPAGAQARAIFTRGDDVAHLGDLPPQMANFLRQKLQVTSTPAVGYKYSHFGIVWQPIWAWDGQYCIYAETDSRQFVYIPIQAADVAKLLNIPQDQVAPPFAYRYPTGLLIILGLVALGVGYHFYQRRKAVQMIQQVEALLGDPQYEQAVKMFGQRAEELAQEKLQAEANRQGTSVDELPENVQERIEEETALQAKHESIEYLVQRGVPEAEAARNIDLIIEVLAAVSEAEEEGESS